MSSIAIGKDVQQCYDAIVSGDGAVTWAVFGYEGQTELRVQASGKDDLTEFPDEFSDGKLQYAFLRVAEPNSKLPKLVLIGWCGDGAPRKGIFQQHFSSVAAKLTGYHVQITARSEEDVSEQSIMKKVEDASGAKYSTSNQSSLFGPTTSKKPTTNSLVNQLKGQSSPAFGARKPTQTEPRLPPSASVKPQASRGASFNATNKKSEDWDVPKTNVHGKVQSSTPQAEVNESRGEPVKSSYQPIGRPDINALRAEAQPENPSLSSKGSSGSSYTPVEVPKTGSLADRMSAFQGHNTKEESPPSAPRKVSNPLASRFGGAIAGTKPAVPTSGPRESKAIGGLAKNFGSEGGKTPSQLWAERKARERGESIPEPVKEPPVKAATYDASETHDEQTSVSSMRDRFAATSITDAPPTPKSFPVPAPPSVPTRVDTPPPVHQDTSDDDDSEAPNPPQAAKLPPPPNMSARPVMSIPQAPSPPPAPEAEGPREEEEPAAREETPEPEPVKNSFKAQLERTIGGGGGAAAVSSTHAELEAPAHNHEPSSAPRAKALYEYEAQEDNEIGFDEGELVTDIEMVDEGWWSGRNAAGKTGLFPSNYVELVEHGDDHDNGASAAHGAMHATAAPIDTSHHTSPSSAPAHATTTATRKGSGQCATAVYEYEAAEEGEIGFAEGEMIEDIQQIDEGWWQGKNARGEEGLFPANYVELIE